MTDTPSHPDNPKEIEEILDKMPSCPGVYLMKDSKGQIIYVGKAVNLRSRVRSYFRESGDQRFSVRFLRGKVKTIETIVTDTEKEALLLENVLIKKHHPRYNIRLRDDKTYISLRLDPHEKWPRLVRVRRRKSGDKALWFGPFSSSQAVKETMRFIQRLFPLRSCPDHVLKNRSRPCVLHQIERCSAPCVDLVSEGHYKEYVDQTILFLRGRREEVVKLLKEKMWEFSKQQAYEKAAEIRDRLQAISSTIEKEKVVSHHDIDRDAVVLQREQGTVLILVHHYSAGTLTNSISFAFTDHGLPESEILESFLVQYYDEGRTVPREVLLSETPERPQVLEDLLAEKRQGAVKIYTPKRGDKRQVLEMARKNAVVELERRLAGEKNRQQVLASLQRKLHLESSPQRIECFDISNIQGSFNVGSMTCFVNGDPEKSQYRRFKVKTVVGQDDFSSMREVLSRRYTRVIREDGDLPNLIVIDGGKGQLNIALEVLKELGLLGKVPVCGLAKARLQGGSQNEEMIRTEERVFLPGRKNPVRFDQSDPALFILTRIRDEAHRFGVTYHRKLRSSSNLRIGLEEIPGVGPKRRRALLDHFKSLAALREAEIDALAEVSGITKGLAKEIHQFFHQTQPVEEEDDSRAFP
jgi:excinuclease ABC subunit C